MRYLYIIIAKPPFTKPHFVPLHCWNSQKEALGDPPENRPLEDLGGVHLGRDVGTPDGMELCRKKTRSPDSHGPKPQAPELANSVNYVYIYI